MSPRYMVMTPHFKVQERPWRIFLFYVYYHSTKTTSGHFRHSDHFLFRLWFAPTWILTFHTICFPVINSTLSCQFSTLKSLMAVSLITSIPSFILTFKSVIYLLHNFSHIEPSFLLLSDLLSMVQSYSFRLVEFFLYVLLLLYSPTYLKSSFIKSKQTTFTLHLKNITPYFMPYLNSTVQSKFSIILFPQETKAKKPSDTLIYSNHWFNSRNYLPFT